LLLAARQRAHVGARLLPEADQREHAADLQPARVEAAKEGHDFAHAQLVRELRFLQLDPEPGPQPKTVALPAVAEHLDVAGVGVPEALEDLHGRRLAGAVRTEHPEALATAHLEIEA